MPLPIVDPGRNCSIAASRFYLSQCEPLADKPPEYDYHLFRVSLNDTPRTTENIHCDEHSSSEEAYN